MTKQPAKHYIAGEWITDNNLDRKQSFSPLDGYVASEYIDGSVSLAEQAIDVAHDTFFNTTWAKSPRLRAKVLFEFADRLEKIKPELAKVMCRENGKLQREASHEIDAGITEARYYGGLARNIFGRMTETEPGQISYLSREACGVAAIITPWNAPVTLLVRSLAPALAAGCTTVIKPSVQTALSHEMVIQCLADIEGLPSGVINSVNGEADVGEAFVSSAKVDVISFTGSSATGKLIMANGAQTLKKMSLELGGKAPAIIFPDADFKKAVADITRCALVHAGQMCVAVSRILVHKDCVDEMRAAFSESFKAHTTGDPFDMASKMGPVIDKANQQRIANLIDQADQETDILVRGGIPGGDLADGSYITPTLFEINDIHSSLVQEELFAPMVGIEVIEDEEDAVAKANATRFGLAASVWTKDVNRAMRVSRDIRSGNMWLNSHMKLMSEAETGGFGESGLGRLHGEEGLADFLETKHIFLDSNG